jgi:hypothetical protein
MYLVNFESLFILCNWIKVIKRKTNKKRHNLFLSPNLSRVGLPKNSPHSQIRGAVLVCLLNKTVSGRFSRLLVLSLMTQDRLGRRDTTDLQKRWSSVGTMDKSVRSADGCLTGQSSALHGISFFIHQLLLTDIMLNWSILSYSLGSVIFLNATGWNLDSSTVSSIFGLIFIDKIYFVLFSCVTKLTTTHFQITFLIGNVRITIADSSFLFSAYEYLMSYLLFGNCPEKFGWHSCACFLPSFNQVLPCFLNLNIHDDLQMPFSSEPARDLCDPAGRAVRHLDERRYQCYKNRSWMCHHNLDVISTVAQVNRESCLLVNGVCLLVNGRRTNQFYWWIVRRGEAVVLFTAVFGGQRHRTFLGRRSGLFANDQGRNHWGVGGVRTPQLLLGPLQLFGQLFS